MALLDEPLRGWKRLLARLPIWLYRLRLGRLLGDRFVLLEHTGHRTGARRQTVLEVIGHDEETGSVYVVAAWAERAHWLQNVRRNPAVRVTTGGRTFAGRAGELSRAEGEGVLRAYAAEHRIAIRELGRLFGSSDPVVLAERMRVVALRPTA